MQGQKHTQELKDKISKSHKEKYKNGYLSKKRDSWELEDPSGNKILIVKDHPKNIREVCTDLGVSYSTLANHSSNITVGYQHTGEPIITGKSAGWKLKKTT